MADVSHTASSAWKHGALGGLVAGLVFALAAMIGEVLVGGAFFDPLRLIASLPLQTEPSEIGVAAFLFAGVSFHVVYSVVLGVIAAFIVRSLGLLHSLSGTVLFMTFYGFALWILNFYVFASLLNVDWFTVNTTPFAQFIYHTFFFGTALGFYMAAAWVHTPEAHRIGRFHAHA